MKLRHHRRTNRGMTLVEVVLVVCVLAFLGFLLLPMIVAPKRRFCPTSCSNNLKQTTLAYKVWAGDHNDKYPMELSVTNGGTMELMTTPDAWRTFQVMSNELSTPRVIFCPDDSTHNCATNWDDNLKTNISYFIAATATDTDPQLLLAGDDNFLLDQKPVQPGLIEVTSASGLKWDGDRHGSLIKQGWFKPVKKSGVGNIALTDGSVQTATDSGLTNYLNETAFTTYPDRTTLVTNRLVIP